MLAGSDPAVQKLPYGPAHCPNGAGAQSSGFNSLPKPGRRRLPSARDGSPRDTCYDLPRGYSPEGRGWEAELRDAYAFKTPSGALAGPAPPGPLPGNDNYDLLPSPPGSVYQTPRTFDKNHNALGPAVPESPGADPPPRPPKPSQGAEQPNPRWGSPQSLGEQNGEAAAPSVAPRRNTLPAVENIRLHRGTPPIPPDDSENARLQT